VRSRSPPTARAKGEGVGSRAMLRNHGTAAQALMMGGSCRHPIGWRRLCQFTSGRGFKGGMVASTLICTRDRATMRPCPLTRADASVEPP
jgi:hypothetical protein